MDLSRWQQFVAGGLLGLQMLLVGSWLAATGRLTPEIVNDTATYADFRWDSPAAILDQMRTPVYPALLRLTQTVWPDHRGVPTLHYLFYCAAVLLFYSGLERFTGRRREACLAASSLLYARILHGYVMTIATDTLAAATGIAVCGLMFRRLSRPGARNAIVLSLLTAVGWLIRPANLFLIVFVPALAWIAPVGAAAENSSPRRRRVLTAAVIALAPLLAYCTLRFAVLGRFSIVSFGGFNQLGVAGQFLQPEDIPRLPVDLQALATRGLARRTSPDRPVGPYDAEPRLHYLRMETQYDPTIWYEFSPAAHEIWGERPGEINSQLRRLATAAIRLHPIDYLIWLAKATRQGVKKVLWDFADNPVLLALLLLAVVKVCRPGFLDFDAGRTNAAGVGVARLMLSAATLYLVLSLAVVIPVCPPLGRMTDAAAVLLAAPLAAWVLTPRPKALAP